MALLTIRDPSTGKVIIDENSFITRHLRTITVDPSDASAKTVTVPGLNTGRPYYLFNANSNLHDAGIMDYNTNVLGYGIGIDVTFSGNTVTYKIEHLTGSYSGLIYAARVNKFPAYLHIGVY